MHVLSLFQYSVRIDTFFESILDCFEGVLCWDRNYGGHGPATASRPPIESNRCELC